MKVAKVRLFLDQPLGQGQTLGLDPAQVHYLSGVMRMGRGAQLRLFNGRDGEWLAEYHPEGKRKGHVRCLEMTAPQGAPADIWLLFAPLKKSRMDMVVEKATELGAARLWPVLTEFTNAERVRIDRLRAQAIEAAEQCGATHVPEIEEPARLPQVLADWPADRALIFFDEQAAGAAARDLPPAPAALLIGPEGGFAPQERRALLAHPAVQPHALGPRILRAETAALAGLVLWQSQRGDWAGQAMR